MANDYLGESHKRINNNLSVFEELQIRILFVAFSDSIHTSRWIEQFDGLGWDLHLFPSIDIVWNISSRLKYVTLYHSFYASSLSGKSIECDPTVKMRGVPVIFPVISRYLAYFARGILHIKNPGYQVSRLSRLIKKLQPDVIHSMEIQGAGYLVAEVKKQYKGQFPPWIVTNWGSDIYLFGRLDAHVDKIKEVLALCDYYSCECVRDVQLARQLGLKGEVLPVNTNTGGFDLAKIAKWRQPGPPSSRRIVLLKGHQGWSGRAFVGLRSLELCADELKGYKVIIYSANNDVKMAAELVSKSTGISIECVPLMSHDEILGLYGRARIHIGLGISDAISTALLESIVMGVFPIQSCTACADEWIVDGESGFIVPPEDPQQVSIAIKMALTNDSLVDNAAEINAKVAVERLEQSMLRQFSIDIYEKIVTKSGGKRE